MSAEGESPSALIALLALPESPPPLPSVHDRLRDVLGTAATVEPDEGTRSVGAELDPYRLRVLVHGEPIPASLLEGPVAEAESEYWPGAGEELASHTSHMAVVVTCVPGADLTTAALLLTRVAAALGEAGSYRGAYWDGCTMVHSATAFSESAAAMGPGQLPLRLWVRFRLLRNEDGTHSLATSGLEPLGRPEIEVRGATAPPEEIQEWAFNLAHYMLAEKQTIEHGQAVGKSREEWVRVYRIPSALDPKRTVLYLDFDEGREDPGRGGPSPTDR